MLLALIAVLPVGLSLASQTAGQSPAPAAEQAPPSVATALPKGKKLFLKDGTFQIIREYQRQGDRVRFYSVERSSWEEIPASLVDWDATQKAQADAEAQDAELAKKIKASELAARTADINTDRSFEVRPGVILPDKQGCYVLDGNTIVPMEQSLAESHADKGRVIERMVTGIPLIPSKSRIDVPGKRAKLRLHSSDPEFYFRPASDRNPSFVLVRADVKGEKRELGSVSTDVVGQNTYKDNEVPLLSWDAARGLYRLTVEQMLTSGEYALVEKTGDMVALYVWDFGVDTAETARSGDTAPAKKKSKK